MEIYLGDDHLVYAFDSKAIPAVSIQSGTRVTFDTLDTVVGLSRGVPMSNYTWILEDTIK
jgi:hypothetical protein